MNSLDKHNKTNCRAEDVDFSCGGVSFTYTLIAAKTILSLVGIFTNILFVFVLRKSFIMERRMNLLLISNAVAEVIHLISFESETVLFLSMQAEVFRFSMVMFIKLQNSLCLVNVGPYTVAILSFGLLVVENYNALCNPMTIQRKLDERDTKFYIIAIWSLATMLLLPLYNIQKTGFEDISYFLYYFSFIVSVTSVMAIIIIYCYVSILQQNFYISKSSKSREAKADLKLNRWARRNVLKMLSSMMLLIYVTKFPVILSTVLTIFTNHKCETHCLIFNINLVGLASSFLYPIICLTFISDCRHETLRIIRCRPQRRVASENNKGFIIQ